MSDYFISRDGQHLLVKLLREIPELIEDLAVTICRLDRTGKGGVKVSSGSDEQPLPINLAASDAKDELHSELASWARHVCESRGIAYDGDGSVLGIARWLDKNIIALAATEGSEEAYVGIEKAMGRCRRTMDIAPEDAVAINDCAYATARQTLLHRNAIALAARQLGPEYKGLTAVRVDTLRRLGQIRSLQCVVATRADLFPLGEVLDAHLAYPTKGRLRA